MTSRDEALRALEKRMRGHIGTPELIPYADELAALLTTRQEVGAVASPDLMAAKSALLEIETYFEEREDVVDGDYGRPAPNREMTMLRWVREVISFLAKADATNDVFEASKAWPEDIRAKLSSHDLRRMGGWAPRTKVGDWRIDTSAGGPILVYQDCSVIESEQARYVLSLIERDANVARDAAEGEAPFISYEKWIGLDEARELYTSPAHTSEARDAEVKAMDVLSLAELVDAAVCLESCEAAWCGDEMELAAPRRRLAKAYSGLRKTLFIAQDALECALRNSKRGSRTNAACSTALEYLRRATKQSDDAAMRQEAGDGT